MTCRRWMSCLAISMAYALSPAVMGASSVEPKFTIGCGVWYECLPPLAKVVEYFNERTGHYFYTGGPQEIESVESGRAGPGWVRTGLAFSAWLTIPSSNPLGGSITCDKDVNPCRPVYRFYSPVSNSHFFTASEAEAALLSGTEWTREGVAFYLPTPDASGQCGGSAYLAQTSRRNTFPIYRLYNNRWSSNDGNHRYTASAASRKILADEGWSFEGIAFCAYWINNEAVDTWYFEHAGAASIQHPDTCRDASFAPDSCIAFRSASLPSVVYQGADECRPIAPNVQCGTADVTSRSDPFNLRTGLYWLGTHIVGYPASNRVAAADRSFVQFPNTNPFLLGLHLNTLNQGVSSYSEISPYRRVSARRPAGGDKRVYPWRYQYGTEYELHVEYGARIMDFIRGPAGAAYGAATMEFLDTRSGHRLQFNVLSYAPGPPAAFEYVARDAKTGMALVGIPSGFRSRFARVDVPMATETSPRNPGEGIGGTFRVAMRASEFRTLLEAARTTDGALSPEPSDYVFERFGVINETFGQGELALTISVLQASRVPVTD